MWSWWNSVEGAEEGRRDAGRGCWRFSAAMPAPGGATFKAHLMDGNPASGFGEQRQASQEMRRTIPDLEVPAALRLFQLDSSGKTKGMPSWHLRSTEELAVLIPRRARGSSRKKRDAQTSQRPPAVLWTTRWYPVRHGQDSCPQGRSGRGHFATLGSP